MDMIGFATTLLTGLIGVIAGAVVAWRIVGQRAAARHARLVVAAREQVATTTRNLRAGNAKLQAELEKEKAASQQRQVAFSAEQRASVARLEGQLRFAYAEIDRLTAAARAAGGSVKDSTIDEHGFAMTRPYER